MMTGRDDDGTDDDGEGYDDRGMIGYGCSCGTDDDRAVVDAG